MDLDLVYLALPVAARPARRGGRRARRGRLRRRQRDRAAQAGRRRPLRPPDRRGPHHRGRQHADLDRGRPRGPQHRCHRPRTVRWTRSGRGGDRPCCSAPAGRPAPRSSPWCGGARTCSWSAGAPPRPPTSPRSAPRSPVTAGPAVTAMGLDADTLGERVAAAELVVNATPLGMQREPLPAPFMALSARPDRLRPRLRPARHPVPAGRRGRRGGRPPRPVDAGAPGRRRAGTVDGARRPGRRHATGGRDRARRGLMRPLVGGRCAAGTGQHARRPG